MKENKISIYKIGKFYNAYNDDGIILHYLFGYKYTNYKRSVGFPESAINKVKTKLEELKISYTMYEKEEKVSEYKGVNKNYNITLTEALKLFNVEKRMDRVKNIIDKLDEKQIDNLIRIIENGEF